MPTILTILAYLLAHASEAVPYLALRDFAGSPADFDATVNDLATQGRIVASAMPDGSTGLMLAPSETSETVNATAVSLLGGDPQSMAVWEEYMAAAGATTVTVNPFRDDAMASGLVAADARLAATSARFLALVRKKRVNDGGLITPGQRAAQVADKAAVALS